MGSEKLDEKPSAAEERLEKILQSHRTAAASNMIGGMETAMSDNIPVLAMTPQIHRDRSYPFKGSQQQLDQMTLYKAVTKWNALVNRWDRIPELVAKAVREA